MKITGGVPASVPNWVPGARNASEASARCNQAFSATGGPVMFTQWWANGYDMNYAC